MSEYLKKRLEMKMFGKPPEQKKNYVIPKKSVKKIEQEKKEREQRGDDDSELQRWHKGRIKYGSPVCEETGQKVERGIFKYAIMSNCHIVPKASCLSLMCHPLNCVILLPDLHFKWDNSSWEEREKWSCWPVVQERLVMMYPDLAPEERRFYPESVLKIIEKSEM